jgi:hypothetical protein
MDYLNVNGPLAFNSSLYNLTWSSHPSATYYKQEYIKKGDVVTKFNSMILFEVLTGKVDLKAIVDGKLAELKSMKAGNPFISYSVIDNAPVGEYMIEFVVTQNAPDGKSLQIAERNIYRYKKYIDKTGENGIILFGLSTRAYGSESKKFIDSIKPGKDELVDKMRQFKIPSVSVKP